MSYPSLPETRSLPLNAALTFSRNIKTFAAARYAELHPNEYFGIFTSITLRALTLY